MIVDYHAQDPEERLRMWAVEQAVEFRKDRSNSSPSAQQVIIDAECFVGYVKEYDDDL